MALKTDSTLQSMKKKFNSKKSKINSTKETNISNNNGNKSAHKSKHIIFDDEDDEDHNGEVKIKIAASEKPKKAEQSRKNSIEIGKQWYLRFEEYNTGVEPIDMKTSEIDELTNLCRKCYESEMPSFVKCNPSDVKWLKTALHKGTSRDRANAGALLVQSNPLANLETLEMLITFAKVTNKQSTDSVDVITDLFINALLPPNRKLISFALRGNDWKSLKKNDSVDKLTKDQIYAYWHIETMIKDQYSEFLRNIQGAIQGTQDSKKGQAIICSAKLLSYAPEKEQMLLSMVVNKLGDPSRVVASKALHQLINVSHKHPAMCGVMANETEKILFRNNITDHAQHFALCFLSQLAPHSNVDVCTKLVNICMSFFKIVVNKGQVNSKIMQAILLCLKHSITDVIRENAKNPGADCGLLSKDTQDTIYRLVHFADIKVSLQTLALLLQIVTALGDGQQHNRFYNALYKKLFDPELVTCSHKFSALFLHIVHRAIHFDRNKSRAQAFIKRLLQAALHFPANITCGCLIIINKLVKARSELNRIEIPPIKVETANSNVIESEKTKYSTLTYDPMCRDSEFTGAQYAIRTELIALTHHYHPSVRVFAQDLIKNANIKFYGDPLIDFSLSYFLDRFAFKNPKKDNAKQRTVAQSFYHKHYIPRGSRGNSVNQLNNTNCTEDERYIFEYLNRKRERRAALGLDKSQANNDEIDDDEFDAYLNTLGGKSKGNETEDDDEELDFMGDFGTERKKSDKVEKKTEDNDQEDDDWDSEPESDKEGEDEFEGGGHDDHDAEFDGSDGSVSLDEDGSDIFESEDENFGNDSDSDAEVSDPEDDDGPPKSKRFKPVSGKEFQKKLKNTNNMSSLFAAVEDFSEMLDDTSKSNNHGTLGEVFNKDKSSEKQIEWESKRLKNAGGGFGRKPKTKRNRSQGKKHRAEPMNKNNKNKPMAAGKWKNK